MRVNNLTFSEIGNRSFIHIPKYDKDIKKNFQATEVEWWKYFDRMEAN